MTRILEILKTRLTIVMINIYISLNSYFFVVNDNYLLSLNFEKCRYRNRIVFSQKILVNFLRIKVTKSFQSAHFRLKSGREIRRNNR